MTRQKESIVVRLIKIEFLVFALGLLALATVTRGGVEVQLAPSPEQAHDSLNQVTQVDVKPTEAPGGTDERARRVELELQATNPYLTLAAPLTHDRGTPGMDIPYTNAASEHGNNTNASLDMNACAPNDPCPNGSTSGDVINCDDNNVCTTDSISPSNECVHSNNSNSCDDNNACTTNDRCANGSCSGTAVECDDSNVCTDDSCNPSRGCVHANNSNSCDDGSFCNGSDTCIEGRCGLHSGDPCPPDDPCDEITQSCGPASLISFQAVKLNNVPITPGTCNLALVPPRCSTGNVNKLCASDDECHVGTSYLLPNKCAGGPNINLGCSSNANCPGSTCISVRGGDVIEVEFFLSRWANELPAGVRLFAVKLDQTGFVSPDDGTVLPMGWCAPVNRIDCTDSSRCPSAYPICSPTAACTCAGHNPDLGAFINASRTDYLLNGMDEISQINSVTLNLIYSGLAIDSIGAADTGVLRYLGTLVLNVSANACGTFAIGFVREENSTFIANPSDPPVQAYPGLQPLVLNVTDCSRQLLSCNPGHCNLDARIAHDRLSFTTKLNANTIEMTFSKPTTGMAAADFEITLVPTLPADILPGILSVTPVTGNLNSAIILLNRRIQQTRWTCIRDKGSNKRCCLGSLPGDVDNNRVSQLADTFEIVENLQGIVAPSLKTEKCDTDRSLQCSPADVLMVVDLLNGADAFIEVNGDVLEVCPAMRLAP